ncbi:MAG TPA: 2-amino-4-hydroxy-6-hydroxymethyldihydropteridine diphosphokinase [Candidatus Saccharimonadales bacterium]|nr:2-amino-4-hydroxy-6-hydroxymethyldihydropteridine diphosphokinase [Candidatus Saccharimonadales bacterium]
MDRTIHMAVGARDGDARSHMVRGLERLRREGVLIERVSSLWETEPVDLPPGKPVLNAALQARTALSPSELLEAVRGVEEAEGRRRGAAPWRSLDLDILLVGDLTLCEPGLEIPHPRFHLRRFNLAPLAEIAPGTSHPVVRRTVAELLAACPDTSWVRPIDPLWALPALHPGGLSGNMRDFPPFSSLRAPRSP